MAAAETIGVPSFERRKPARRPLPALLPPERIAYPAPSVCPCCGDGRLRKIGEDMTETLELVPRQWKVIQHACSRRRYRIRSRAGAPGRSCSPIFCSPSTVCTCRFPDRHLCAGRHRSRRFDARRWTAFTRAFSITADRLAGPAGELIAHVAVGRKNWTFAGSNEARRADAIYTLMPSSTTSIRRPGSPTCSHACRITGLSASKSCCPGIGAGKSSPLKLRERTCANQAVVERTGC